MTNISYWYANPLLLHSAYIAELNSTTVEIRLTETSEAMLRTHTGSLLITRCAENIKRIIPDIELIGILALHMTEMHLSL